MKTCLAVMLALVVAALPARAFSPDEEAKIRAAAQGMEGLATADAALAPGFLSATARTLPPLLRLTEPEHVREGLGWLVDHRLLRDAALSATLHENHEACGPYRNVTRTVFRPGVITAVTPFFLYRPATGEYLLGGVLPLSAQGEVLVRREDGVLVLMLPDGRVVFVPEKCVRISRDEDVTPEPGVRELPAALPAFEQRDGYAYSGVHVGRAMIHLVRIDLDRLPMSVAVSPFYNAIEHGLDRTQPVDGMAKRFGAKVAINGTFFIDQSSHPQYGFPIGSMMIGGKLAFDLTVPALLRFERSYAAYTDDGRLVLGHTGLPGNQIRAMNLAGQFDPNKVGSSKILALGTGFGWLIRDRHADAWKDFAGKQFDASFYSRNSHRARSLLGVDYTGHQAFVVAEEEGANSPLPLSLPDLSEWVANRAKIQDMVFLDGGGSTQLVIEGKNVSAPSDGSYRKNSTAVLFLSPK